MILGSEKSAQPQIEKFRILCLIAIPLFLNSCAGDIVNSNSYPYLNGGNTLEIIEKNPLEGAADVPTNKEILLTTNNVLEPFIENEHDRNFEILTVEGDRLPANVISGQLVPNPLNPNEMVQQISLRPAIGSLMPQRKYIVMWRDSPSLELGGVESPDGQRLAQGKVSFKTGSASGSPRPFIEVSSMSPGIELTKESFTISSIVEHQWTMSARPKISFLMSERVRHYDHDQMKFGNQLSAEMSRKPICGYNVATAACSSAVTVGVLNSDTLSSELIQGIEDNIDNPSLWAQFWNNRFYRYPGDVWTEENRRVVYFQFRDDFVPTPLISQAAQVIVIILHGFEGASSAPSNPKVMENEFFAGAFFHSPGMTFPGFPNYSPGSGGQ